MKVLVTGHKGYIGTVLTRVLAERGYKIVGYDTNYYVGCEIGRDDQDVVSVVKDIRDISLDDMCGFDAVVHLAALSNDPLGELDPRLTDEINRDATIRLSELAKAAGVKRFIYSSSQSMYGISGTDTELDEDNSEKHPLTAYARAKWDAECALKELSDNSFCVVCFRPSTVFGSSPRLRCDIVFNNLVACAYTTGKIEIKSDGTPCRPVVHVLDVCSAFIAGLEAPQKIVAGESFNIGIPNGNYMVRELAEAAKRVVPGCSLVFTGEHGSDSRTYRVSFKKILSVLKDYFKPQWNLDKGGHELVDFFRNTNFNEAIFRGRCCTRLQQIKYLLQENQLDEHLRWSRKL
jgi:nucleoside-diphosphate-sugar epimerase